MRVHCTILTREGRLRFKFLKLEHGLLHDTQEKKTYALVSDAYPTNLAGPRSRTYFIHETSAQTVKLHADESHEVHGATVAIREPLNMVARIRMPGHRGDDGTVRDVHLTAESIYDRTLSAQVRRLGNRRIQWFHALLFVSLGVAICLALVAAISLFAATGESGAHAPPPAIRIDAEPQEVAGQSGPVKPQDMPAPPLEAQPAKER